VPFVVALDRSADDPREFIERAAPTHPSVIDTEHVVAELYHIVNVPTMIWIDEKGRVCRPHDAQFGTDTFTAVTGKRSERIIGLFLCIFCASILVPLPMTNTVPGFAVAIASFGLMQKDGLMVIAGLTLGTAWVSGLVGAVMFGAVSLFG